MERNQIICYSSVCDVKSVEQGDNLCSQLMRRNACNLLIDINFKFDEKRFDLHNVNFILCKHQTTSNFVDLKSSQTSFKSIFVAWFKTVYCFLRKIPEYFFT